MQESLLQFIWSHRLFDTNSFVTTDGKEVQILNFGIQNNDAGPDFLDSKINIDNTIWAGTIEIHNNASDWYKHKHDENAQYNNVILHVVYKNDCTVKRYNGEAIPTIELAIPDKLLSHFNQLIENKTWIKCENFISSMDSFSITSFLDSLLVERLERKTRDLQQLLIQTNNNWEQSFYIFLAKQFGFKVNAFPFEQLANSIPMEYYPKIKNSLFQLEALLFGQAGFLTKPNDDYSMKLAKEYEFLCKKFNLQMIDFSLWKFLRLRPHNFPSIRIAQFASLIHNSNHLFSKILEAKETESIYSLLKIKVSDYWLEHFRFGKLSTQRTKNISQSTFNALIINAIIPTLFLYGKNKDNSELKERALQFLEKLEPEKNNIIKKWAKTGITADSAFQSQALLELHNNYCLQGKCIKCRIGKVHLLSILK